MPRYEATDSLGRKFFTIAIVDTTSVRTRHGRVGGEPKESVEKFATAAAAQRAAARAIVARVQKGYAEVEPEALLEGPSETLTALERKIAEHPDDLASCAVYGDWLQERADPFGEVLALHVAIAEEQDPRRRAVLEADLDRARNSSRLFGPLGKHLPRLDLTWKVGILEEVRIRTGPREHGLSSAALLGRLFQLPLARFVSRLSFPAFAFHDFGLLLADIAASGGLRTIRTLDVEDAAGPGANSRRKLECLSALTTLRSLSFPFSRFDATGLCLPLLETFAFAELSARPTDVAKDIATLAAADLPRVTRVVMSYVSSEVKLQGLASLESLHIIRIRGMSFGGVEETIRDLHASLPQVDTFELDDAAAGVVARLTTRWPSLRIVVGRGADGD